MSENMVLNWALRLDYDKIKMPDSNKRELDKVLVPDKVAQSFLKAVYDGNGFKRMDLSALNYTHHYSLFPNDIPLFHFWGANDCLAPMENIRYSQFYPHKYKKVYLLERVEDLKKVEILPEKSQVVDFVIEGASHLDLLYGKKAQELVYSLFEQIIEKIWSDWS